MNLYRVHREHIFPVGNKTLYIFKGGYIVGFLRFSGILFQGRGVTIYRVHIKSVSFEIYGYSPIRPIGSEEINFCYFHRKCQNRKFRI